MPCPDTPTREARTSEVHPGSFGAEAAGAIPNEALEVGALASPACVSGELTSGFTAVYQQTVSAAYSYFYHQVGNIEDAEDLTATTFSKALASFERYQTTRGTVAAWLFGIASARRMHPEHGRDRPGIFSIPIRSLI